MEGSGSLVRPLSRRTTTAITTLFDRKPTPWAEPEKSIGQFELAIKGEMLWKPQGPASDAFKKIAASISDLLDSHRDYLTEGEEILRTVAFNMWMVGHDVNCARPTIVIASKSKACRNMAIELIKKHELLAEWPGIALRSMERLPAFRTESGGGHEAQSETEHGTDIYLIGSPAHACGAPIMVGETRKATLGGVLLIRGAYYGLTVDHTRSSLEEAAGECIEDGTELAFDDYSEIDDDYTTDITSRGTIPLPFPITCF
jgi:hypothetical protein